MSKHITSTRIRAITIAAASLTAIAGLTAGTADAAGTKTLRATTPSANTVVLTVTNSDTQNGTTCEVYGSGPTTFRSGLMRVAPRNSTTVTVASVPAGNYTLSWGCGSFAQEKHLITVSGRSSLSSTPHVVPNGAAPAATPDVVGIVVGVLRGLGSVA